MESSGGSSDPLLAPGFRFYPTEEELLTFYLRHRLAGTRPVVEHLIPVVDIYGYHPSELRAMAGVANVADTEQWFFFCPRAERELHGGRPARTTPSGYWKATGSPSYVYSSSSSSTPSNRVIGEKRTMVFYQGRAPTGNKTRWKMNEYKAVVADEDTGDVAPTGAPMLRNEFSVCRVYISTGTLRSFDRRPLNPPGGGLAVAAQQAVYCGYPQQQLQQPLLPPPATVTAARTRTTSHQQQQMFAAVVVNDAGADHNNRRRHETALENSHDSSSSGSQGAGVVDGGEDAATAIDWDSLILPADHLAFSGVDDLTRVIWPHNN